jgi:hypothetical protein
MKKNKRVRNAPDVKRYYENMFELSESKVSTPMVLRDFKKLIWLGDSEGPGLRLERNF